MSAELSAATEGSAHLDMDVLFASSPKQQKQMLGEALWPVIYQKHPRLAAKIQDMILEMDINELIELYEYLSYYDFYH